MKINVIVTRAENCTHYNVGKGAIIQLDLDAEYLPICLSSEIYENNTRTPMEAKKAQAVAARTYAASYVKKGTIISDVSSDQAFSWKDLSSIPNCVRAVSETSGQVLVYNGTLITAWYSSSNGGRTKRSDEAWSASTPWTISQDDPWDTAARAKWGNIPASHSVGMSQIGAAYAASIAIAYDKILRFYYPNTSIAGNFGSDTATITTPQTPQDKEPTTPTPAADAPKTNIGLVEHAKAWLGNPYWYGTCCYKCTESLLKTKTAQYPAHYTTSRMPRYRKDIQEGKSCADCVGLIKGYHWLKNGVIVNDRLTDVNVTGLFNRASIKGTIKTLPEVPGLVLYKSNHVGVYEGNGAVIEAKGFASGIIRSQIENTPWTYWLADPFISYEGYEDQLVPVGPKVPYTAIVVTKSSPLNIWKDPSKTKSLLQVKKGDTLTVLGNASTIGWLTVEKNGVQGVADSQYLVPQQP